MGHYGSLAQTRSKPKPIPRRSTLHPEPEVSLATPPQCFKSDLSGRTKLLRLLWGVPPPDRREACACIPLAGDSRVIGLRVLGFRV